MPEGDKIKKNWKAIREAEKLMKEKTGDPKVGFNATRFFLSSEESIFIPIWYRKKKGEGFTLTQYKTLIRVNFCPFTGKPLYKDI